MITNCDFTNMSKQTIDCKEPQNHIKWNQSESSSKQVIILSHAFLSHSLTIKRTEHTQSNTYTSPIQQTVFTQELDWLIFLRWYKTMWQKAYKLDMIAIRSLLLRSMQLGQVDFNTYFEKYTHIYITCKAITRLLCTKSSHNAI